MNEMKNISLVTESLENVTGGADGWQGSFSGPWMTVCNITSGYLALRTDHFRDENNEIGKMYNGQQVQMVGDDCNGFTWVYAPTLNKSGWVTSYYIK